MVFSARGGAVGLLKEEDNPSGGLDDVGFLTRGASKRARVYEEGAKNGQGGQGTAQAGGSRFSDGAGRSRGKGAPREGAKIAGSGFFADDEKPWACVGVRA